MTYGTLVIGTDGSDTAELALRQAAKLAHLDEARLVIVTAYEPHDDQLAEAYPRMSDDIKWMLTDRDQAEELARKGRAAARKEGVSDVVVRSEPGDAAVVLLDTAEEFNAGAIVVGSKGLGSAAHFLLGSVASRVAHHAPCDVLIVHTV